MQFILKVEFVFILKCVYEWCVLGWLMFSNCELFAGFVCVTFKVSGKSIRNSTILVINELL
jgi:hypothetical protein